MDLRRRRQLIEIVRRQFRPEWHDIHGDGLLEAGCAYDGELHLETGYQYGHA